MDSRRPSARSGSSSTLSSPHRAGWVTAGSWQALMGSPEDVAGTAALPPNPRNATDITKELHDANLRLMELSWSYSHAGRNRHLGRRHQLPFQARRQCRIDLIARNEQAFNAIAVVGRGSGSLRLNAYRSSSRPSTPASPLRTAEVPTARGSPRRHQLRCRWRPATPTSVLSRRYRSG